MSYTSSVRQACHLPLEGKAKKALAKAEEILANI